MTSPQSKSVLFALDGCTFETAIVDGALDASTLIKSLRDTASQDPNLDVVFYDPGFTNTASARSRVTFIDGDAGVLEYRGYAVEELAEHSSFLEVAYLLIHGELPTKEEFGIWSQQVMSHTFVHEDLIQYLHAFRYDAHPMAMFVAALSAMSTHHPEANPILTRRDVYDDLTIRNKQIYRVLGKFPTVAACSYRHRIGRRYNYPDTSRGLSYTENFLYMMDAMGEPDYRPHPELVKALDVLFIIHADHELNCSTSAVRHLASTRLDLYTAMAGGASALFGGLHGGASEAVVRQLEYIEHVDRIDQFLDDVKAKKRLLMGFGHRIYRNYDPRAKILKKYADRIMQVVGHDPLLEVAKELEQRALSDDYFTARKLYPNVDFYSGLIYRCMGFPLEMYSVLFALPRAAGWLAHYFEAMDDEDRSELDSGATHLIRPRQLYIGAEPGKPYVTAADRNLGHNATEGNLSFPSSILSRRRQL
uniref:Citrate synthase n=1 Tax=Compsopogon caeruleus TaxID=31354 RepID=A0A7S1TGL8_9RHOD|mmetsp:Transcript_3146/g.5963  ORF Transcript_3146/g.5963 Transcript_3146/m.5963 type:complete len:476 (+) Transcript_3146:27-1454(+)